MADSKASAAPRGKQSVQQLHVVGFTTDGENLILSDSKGSKAGSFLVALDDALRDAVDGADRQGRGDVSSGDERDAHLPRRRRPNSSLSPREMQARLRAGQSVAEVAAEAGVDESWVERFANPVLAEQAKVIGEALQLTFSKARRGPSHLRLQESVRSNLIEKGVNLSEEEFDSGWSAWQMGGPVWAIGFKYHSRGRPQDAKWVLDMRTESLAARNPLASALGYIEVTELAEDVEPPFPEPPGPGPAPRAPTPEPALRRSRTAGPAATGKRPTARAPATNRSAPPAPAKSRPSSRGPTRPSAGRGSSERASRARSPRARPKGPSAGEEPGPAKSRPARAASPPPSPSPALPSPPPPDPPPGAPPDVGPPTRAPAPSAPPAAAPSRPAPPAASSPASLSAVTPSPGSGPATPQAPQAPAPTALTPVVRPGAPAQHDAAIQAAPSSPSAEADAPAGLIAPTEPPSPRSVSRPVAIDGPPDSRPAMQPAEDWPEVAPSPAVRILPAQSSVDREPGHAPAVMPRAPGAPASEPAQPARAPVEARQGIRAQPAPDYPTKALPTRVQPARAQPAKAQGGTVLPGRIQTGEAPSARARAVTEPPEGTQSARVVPGRAQAEPTQAQPTQAEPTQTQPTQAEAAPAQPAQAPPAEPAQAPPAEPAQAPPAEAAPAQPAQARRPPRRTVPGRPVGAKSLRPPPPRGPSYRLNLKPKPATSQPRPAPTQRVPEEPSLEEAPPPEVPRRPRRQRPLVAPSRSRPDQGQPVRPDQGRDQTAHEDLPAHEDQWPDQAAPEPALPPVRILAPQARAGPPEPPLAPISDDDDMEEPENAPTDQAPTQGGSRNILRRLRRH